MKGFRYLKDVTTLELNREACTGCGRCLQVCPHQVFSRQDKGPIIITDRDACMECGACMRNCAVGAVKVDAGVGCASGMINEWLRERKLASLGGGCCS